MPSVPTKGICLVAPKTKNSFVNAGDKGLIPGVGSSLGEGTGYPLQYSCLGNPTDRGARQATVHGVARVGHNLLMKPPQPYHLRFQYYHLIVNLDACIFKSKVHFSFRPYISTLILGKPENNYNDL